MMYLLRMILFLVVVLAACELEAAESKDDHADSVARGAGLASSMLAAIREPGPGEMVSSAAVVRHLLGALRDHDIDEYLKCFPVRRELETSARFADEAVKCEIVGVTKKHVDNQRVASAEGTRLGEFKPSPTKMIDWEAAEQQADFASSKMLASKPHTIRTYP